VAPLSRYRCRWKRKVEANLELEMEEGTATLAVALNDSRYGLFVVLKTMVFILLCLLGISLSPHKGFALLLDVSFKPCHLALPTSREFAGIKLWER